MSLTQTIEEIIEQAFRSLPDLKEDYDRAQGEIKALAKREAELTSQINEAVIISETSIKGSLLHAIFSKGRTTWDGAKLEGYAAAHPEINVFKKTGSPSVSIREVKKSE